MSAQYLHKLLTLLTAMVLIDRRVFKSEIEAMVTEMSSLQDALAVKSPMSGSDIRDWFADHRTDVEIMLESPGRESAFIELLVGLSEFPLKLQLLDAMANLAVADAQLHAREFDLLQLAAEFWEFDLPGRP